MNLSYMNVKKLSLLFIIGLLLAWTNEIPNNKPQADHVYAQINQLKENSSFVSEEISYKSFRQSTITRHHSN